MNIKVEVHSNNNYQRKLSKLNEWKVPLSTTKEIKEFIEKAKLGQVQYGKKLSDRTLSKYLSLLKTNLEFINKPTNKITKSDIEKLDKHLSKFKSSNGYKLCLQVFLKWKLGENKMRNLAGWLDTRDRKKTPDYLSEAEVDKLFKNCKSPAERFLVAVLFDSGARIEEFLNIRFEDIQMPEGNNNFIRLTLKEEYSKTAGRVISLWWKNSLNAVRDYLDERIKEGIKSNDQVYTAHTYDAIRFLVGRMGKKFLNKKVTPHLFRHSSATYYATKLNRQELCYRYGWKFSSNMPDVYISRSGMESNHLDEKFKNTELEELQKQFDLDKFETGKEIESLKSDLKSVAQLSEMLIRKNVASGNQYSKEELKEFSKIISNMSKKEIKIK